MGKRLAFRRIAFVASIAVCSTFSSAQTQETISSCRSNPNRPPFTALELAIEGIVPRMSPEACLADGACPNGRRRLDWASIRLNADLARAEVRRIVGSSESETSRTNVAVLDSGFRRSHEPYLGALSIQYNNIGDEDSGADEFGHGTAVASLIADRQIGIAEGVSLNIYRIEPPTQSSMTVAEMITQSIRHACESGNEIINLSADYDLSGELLNFLNQRGCLLIQAAGNNFERRAGNIVDDGHLLVAAQNTSGISPVYSGTGELTAPGWGVPARVPEDSRIWLSSIFQNEMCGDSEDNLRFVSGTSFSAPIVSGVAALVLRVLRVNPRFGRLSGADRLVVINRILRASEVSEVGEGYQRFLAQNSIDAIRAVTIANLWNHHPQPVTTSALTLRGLLLSHPAPICHQDLTRCASSFVEGCTRLRSCLSSLRYQNAICADSDLSLATLVNLEVRTSQAEQASYRMISRPTVRSLLNPLASGRVFDQLFYENLGSAPDGSFNREILQRRIRSEIRGSTYETLLILAIRSYEGGLESRRLVVNRFSDLYSTIGSRSLRGNQSFMEPILLEAAQVDLDVVTIFVSQFIRAVLRTPMTNSSLTTGTERERRFHRFTQIAGMFNFLRSFAREQPRLRAAIERGIVNQRNLARRLRIVTDLSLDGRLEHPE